MNKSTIMTAIFFSQVLVGNASALSLSKWQNPAPNKAVLKAISDNRNAPTLHIECRNKNWDIWLEHGYLYNNTKVVFYPQSKPDNATTAYAMYFPLNNYIGNQANFASDLRYAFGRTDTPKVFTGILKNYRFDNTFVFDVYSSIYDSTYRDIEYEKEISSRIKFDLYGLKQALVPLITSGCKV